MPVKAGRPDAPAVLGPAEARDRHHPERATSGKHAEAGPSGALPGSPVHGLLALEEQPPALRQRAPTCGAGHTPCAPSLLDQIPGPAGEFKRPLARALRAIFLPNRFELGLLGRDSGSGEGDRQPR